ncbi:MAG: DUF4402 domain-containing protein [Balneolaceae bacterium]|nr:DUF4402 domain-containing protein [Balneolaceae bacterium]
MKKLLTITFILLLFSYSGEVFAQDSDNTTADARVLADITVTANRGLNFGDLTATAQTPSISPGDGTDDAQFEVEADESSSVTLEFTQLPEGASGGDGSTFTYYIENGAGDDMEMTFAATDAAWTNNDTFTGETSFDPTSATPTATIDGDGTIYVWLGGDLAVTSGQASGDYTGTITLEATYN